MLGRYYWFLAYTLINNPELLVYRKIEEEVGEDEKKKEKCTLRRHAIVLARQKKVKGEKTSDMYVD